jgi:hypothetical protein
MPGPLAFVYMPGLGAVAAGLALAACAALALLVAVVLLAASVLPRRAPLRRLAWAWGAAGLVLVGAAVALVELGERASDGRIADPAALVVPPLALVGAALAGRAAYRRPGKGAGTGAAADVDRP